MHSCHFHIMHVHRLQAVLYTHYTATRLLCKRSSSTKDRYITFLFTTDAIILHWVLIDMVYIADTHAALIDHNTVLEARGMICRRPSTSFGDLACANVIIPELLRSHLTPSNQSEQLKCTHDIFHIVIHPFHTIYFVDIWGAELFQNACAAAIQPCSIFKRSLKTTNLFIALLYPTGTTPRALQLNDMVWFTEAKAVCSNHVIVLA